MTHITLVADRRWMLALGIVSILVGAIFLFAGFQLAQQGMTYAERGMAHTGGNGEFAMAAGLWLVGGMLLSVGLFHRPDDA